MSISGSLPEEEHSPEFWVVSQRSRPSQFPVTFVIWTSAASLTPEDIPCLEVLDYAYDLCALS